MLKDVIRKGYADTAAGQLHYRRVEGGGAPLILLHRTPTSSASFVPMLRRIAGKRTAIAFDTPGFGLSFRPEGRPRTPDYARWFLEAIDALGIGAFHLVPHHTGTHFAAEIAVLAPERTSSLLLSGVLYAGPKERAGIRAGIGDAQPIDADGAHLSGMWSLMRSMFPAGDLQLIHDETIEALTAFEGRDQAFDAILSQDFARVLAGVACPIRILQACDDPLMPMLGRVRTAHPEIPVDLLGPAGMAAPERQPDSYAAAALAFAAACDSPIDPRAGPHVQGTLMTDRRFQLVRTPTGFDLEQVQAPVPTVGANEVLIRVHALSLNRRDISIRDLSYPVGETDRFTPLSDAAGEIVAIGKDVTRWAVGDRVCSTFFQAWDSGRITFPAIMSALGAGGVGVLADHVALSEDGIARIPEEWSYEEGASIACAGVTAWTALTTLGGLQPDDWVLVIGTGGVAIFALQIAVAAGAKVVILSSSDEKLARAKAIGAAATINYNKTPEWEAAVKQATGGGVHHAIELGGVGTLGKSIASMTVGGHVALIGGLAGFGGDISAFSMIMAALRISAVSVGSQSDHRNLTDFLVKHDIRPVIDSVFDIADVEKAYERAAVGAFGKVVVRMRA